MSVQEDSHRDLIRIVKLIQSCNDNQDIENQRIHNQMHTLDKMVRLIEERAVNQRAWGEELEVRLTQQVL
jgi:hypothetical protein